MKAYKYLLYILICCYGCSDNLDYINKPTDVKIEPMTFDVSLSKSGEYSLSPVDGFDSFTFELERNSDLIDYSVLLSEISEDDLNSGEMLLPSDCYDSFDKTIDFKEGVLKSSLTINFKNLTQEFLEQEQKYVFGLKLHASDERILVNEDKNEIRFMVVVGYKGSIENPYIISTVDDLQNIQDKLDPVKSIYFKLNSNLDLSTIDSWEPINDDIRKKIFFDGQNHTISNLKCEAKSNASLFGVLSGECKNLKFHAPKITSTDLSGVVAAKIESGIVENVIITEAELAGENECGGICGIIKNGTINKVSISCAAIDEGYGILGGSNVGGIAGKCESSSEISQCSFTGKVSSSVAGSAVGGIVGGGSSSSISNSYSTNTTISSGYNNQTNGGIIGKSYDNMYIEYCWSDAEVNSQTNVGGILGTAMNSPAYIINCIAWNTKLTHTNANASRPSGRICGRINGYASKEDIKNFIKDSYANPYMEIYCNGTKQNIEQQTIESLVGTAQDDKNGTKYCFHYDGLDGESLVNAAYSLNWDSEIWDLTKETPQLKWLIE